MKHVITYPGFAEGLSAKGLFDDIAKAFPGYTYHMLPFYEETPDGNRVIHSVEKHKNILQDYMDTLDGRIIVCVKCGGHRPVTSMDQKHISRVDAFVSFNAPWDNDKLSEEQGKAKLEERFISWEGIKQDDGSWLIPRDKQKTSFYVVSKEYMNEASGVNLIENYRSLASNPATKLYMIRGLDDKVIPPLRADRVEGAIFIDIEGGDHHLLGESRVATLGALALNKVL